LEGVQGKGYSNYGMPTNNNKKVKSKNGRRLSLSLKKKKVIFFHKQINNKQIKEELGVWLLFLMRSLFVTLIIDTEPKKRKAELLEMFFFTKVDHLLVDYDE
jgi:hypothetical protein